jgi:hypothetical protein
MKNRILLYLIFTLAICDSAKAQKTKFFVMSHLAGAGDLRTVEGAVTYFNTQFTNYLQEKYPCAKVLTLTDVNVFLGHEREKELLGADNQKPLSEIGEAMGCDYLINLEISILPGPQFGVSASCIPYRTKFPMSRFAEHSPLSENSGHQNLKNCDEVARKLVESLKRIEICPFKGSINVEVRTELTDKKTESHPVFCNGGDGLYKITTENNKNSDVNWTLNKTGRYFVNGSVSYNLHEESNLEEQNDCYTCTSGRQGPRMYFEKTVKTAKVDGLSNESVSEGQKIEDARAEITFSEDGTYTLKVKAASKKGDLKERTEKRAEGTCDIKTDPPENIDKKADVPLIIVFGPFPGTSLDKILSHSDTYSTVDPITKEKTTITYDFNLKRD